MKSLKKYPCVLIENTCNEFVKKLWEISPEPKCMELAAALEQFREDLRGWIISELTAASIVEEEQKEKNIVTILGKYLDEEKIHKLINELSQD